MVDKNKYTHKHYTYVREEKEADAVAWAFLNKDEMVRFPFKFEDIGDEELRVNITYTGLCASDTHTVRSKWGGTNYPICPGHEFVGIVSKVGSRVKKFKVGDRVGFGPRRDHCGECQQCIKGEDNLCQGMEKSRRLTYGEYWGGYATASQQPAKWAFKIPENLPSEKMAPLMCAGVTVHAPLVRYAKPGDRVAVIGIGGLGHLAVMYASKFGCEVTGFTSTKDKLDLLKELGAKENASSTDEEELEKLNGKFEIVINTLSVSNEKVWGKYLGLTAPGGTFIQVGLPPIDEKFQFQAFQIVSKNIKIAGSIVGSRRETKEMLDFSSRHNIVPMVELFGFEDFPKAVDTLENGKPHFRCVVNVEEWSKKNGFYKEN